MAGARLRFSGIEGASRGSEQIKALFDSIGKQEQIRRERKQLNDIAQLVSRTREEGRDATTQEILSVLDQPAETGTGLQGFFQKLGGRLQPEPGRIGTEIRGGIVSEALKRALTPQIDTPEGLETTRVTQGPSGVTRTFARKAQKAQAGPLQVAKEGDQTGLPTGTVFQAGPQGKVSIISEAGEQDLLTIPERRKRQLIEAGIEPKAISDLENEKLQIEVDKNRKEFEGFGTEGKLTGDDRVKVSTGLRKEFNALSADFRKIRDSFSRINAAASDPSAAGDLAIIFNFMKILDPGSVVRESEFATAENAAGIPDKVRNLWNKALTGERITFNRDDFVNTAKRLFESQEAIQGRLADRYSTLATRFGVDAQDVITETGEFTEQITPTEPETLQTQGLSPAEEAEFQQLLLESRQ